jgi:Lectin C-type domain
MKYATVFAALFAFVPVAANAGVIAGPVINLDNGHVYYLLDTSSWTAAEAEAVRMGGHLATVRNASENRWIAARFGSIDRRILWIGLHNPVIGDGSGPRHRKNFMWVSGEPVRFTYWIWQPNNDHGLEYYGQMCLTNGPKQDGPMIVESWNDAPDELPTWTGFGVVEIVPAPISSTSRNGSPTSQPSPASTQAAGIAQIDKALALKVAAAQDAYRNQVTTARRERLDALKVLFDQALASKNLDGALALRNMIRSTEDEILRDQTSTAPVKAALAERGTLESFLPGSTWEWGGGTPESKRWNDGRIVFEADGTVTNPNWQGQGGTMRWEIVDRRTVLLTSNGGAQNGFFAAFRFSEGLDSYTGVGRNGDTLPVNRRLP